MKYTDEEVRRLPLQRARAELFDELVATPYAERAPSHRRTFRIALSAVAATAVAAVGVGVVVQDQGGESPSIAPPATTAPGSPDGTASGPAASRDSSAATTGSPQIFPVALKTKAKRMPRLLLDAAGWEITTVYGFGEDSGTLRFSRGDHELSLEWYPASQYEGYYRDRHDDPQLHAVGTELMGETAMLVTYSDDDHATMLKPSGRTFVELRGSGMSQAEYLALTAQLRQVGVQEFLEAMPASVVLPGEEGNAAARVLADIPVPPGFTFKPTGDVGDAYQFGAAVTGQVFCAWTAYYRHGDAAKRTQAVTAVESSHGWDVLNQMNADGDFPEMIWEYADALAAGDLRPPAEYRSALGCRG